MKKLILFMSMTMLLCFNVSAQQPESEDSYRETIYRTALIMAYSAVNNVFEDENIKLEIYNEKLYATNKTPQTIYLDLSQCFVYHNEVGMPMYNADKRKDNKASKGGLTTSIDEFISLAPANGNKLKETFVCDLTFGIYGDYTTSETPSGDFTEYDQRLISIIGNLYEESVKWDAKGKDCMGPASCHLTEDESINNIGVSVAYSFNKRSDDWKTVSISNWVSDVILAPYYVEMPKELSKKEKSGFQMKEQNPAIIHIKADMPFEFDEDKSPIIVADWEGNFKKGTFKLSPTHISKTKGKTKAFVGSLLVGPAALAFLQEQYYKNKIHFDGNEAYWGLMEYQKNLDLPSLKQKDKQF